MALAMPSPGGRAGGAARAVPSTGGNATATAPDPAAAIPGAAELPLLGNLSKTCQILQAGLLYGSGQEWKMTCCTSAKK